MDEEETREQFIEKIDLFKRIMLLLYDYQEILPEDEFKNLLNKIKNYLNSPTEQNKVKISESQDLENHIVKNTEPPPPAEPKPTKKVIKIPRKNAATAEPLPTPPPTTEQEPTPPSEPKPAKKPRKPRKITQTDSK